MSLIPEGWKRNGRWYNIKLAFDGERYSFAGRVAKVFDTIASPTGSASIRLKDGYIVKSYTMTNMLSEYAESPTTNTLGVSYQNSATEGRALIPLKTVASGYITRDVWVFVMRI